MVLVVICYIIATAGMLWMSVIAIQTSLDHGPTWGTALCVATGAFMAFVMNWWGLL